MLKQTHIRADPSRVSFQEFVIRRRATSGGYTVWSMINSWPDEIKSTNMSCLYDDVATVEYAADIDLPDYVFSHPTVVAVLDTMTDIATIQNVSQIVQFLISGLLFIF